MKAAVLRAIGQALSLEEVPQPAPGPGEVLVKTAACGICGTDLHIAQGWGYTPELPFVMGHEPAGVIAQVGEGVAGFAPGDRVVPNIFYACGACAYCQSDRETQCLNLGGILGVLGHPGGYGEYFAIPARQVFRLPEDVSFAEGGVIADAVVTAVHAAERGRVGEGETAVIVGVGGVGAAMLQVSRACGARTIAVEISDRKVTWARDLGADEALNARAVRVPEAVREMTDALGAQVVFDCVGSEQTLRDSLDCLANGGRLVIVGYTQERCPVDPRAIAVREIEVLGSRSGSRRCTAEAIQRVSNPSWKPIVSDHFPLEEVNEALEFLREGGALGRIVLTHGA